jgi:predicted pyridoxine 5'-phosphate oxidase superfamily flavin-nucleotide-binding protein
MTYLEAMRRWPAQRRPSDDRHDSGSPSSRRLQQQRGTERQAERFYAEQVLDHLNPRMREFIRRQEMMFIATADEHGVSGSSFRAGPAGFVHVLDARRLLWPEYRGNGVMASVGNVAVNPHVGLLFLDFFRETVGLHVNGRAEIVADDDIRDAHPDLPVDPRPGRRPVHWLTAQVDEAYIHCSKHIPRLSRRPTDGEGRSRDKRADFFSVQADRSAPATAVEPSGEAEDVDPPRRFSIRRLLTYRAGPRRTR